MAKPLFLSEDVTNRLEANADTDSVTVEYCVSMLVKVVMVLTTINGFVR